MHIRGDPHIQPVATPQDYLEKIFQIPFTVRPMGKLGFGRLIDRLLTPAVDVIEMAGPPAEDVSAPSRQPLLIEIAPNESAHKPPSSSGEVSKPSQGVASAAPGTKPAEIVLPAQALSISFTETEFARSLYMLLATPRSAKRFANIYRLLKSSLSADDLKAFEGRPAVPGTFQLPMVLLALLVGKPKLAAKLFPIFLARARADDFDWWEAGWKSLEGSEEELRNLLTPILEVGYFPGSPRQVVQWLPQVARYSFMTASIFLKEMA